MPEIAMEAFRLSPLQRHLSALQCSDLYSPYRTNCVVRIEGPLDIGRLQIAFRKTIERHEILRTIFPPMPGLPLPAQVITNECSLALAVYDLSFLPLTEQEKIVPHLLSELQLFPLCLDNGPLLQAFLILSSKELKRLVLLTPALNADNNSFHILARETLHYYASTEIDDVEQDEPVQYADVVEWQYELLESSETTLGRKYWQSLESSQLASVTLPYRREVETPARFVPDATSLYLAETLIARTETLARLFNVSSNAVFLSCWLVTLRRIASSRDLLISVGYAGRNEELLSAIGLFAKYLPLPFQLLDKWRFSDLVSQVEEKLSEASLWQDYFGWEQVETGAKQRAEPFCSFGFDYETLPPPRHLENLVFSIEDQHACLDRFDARLSCMRNAQGLLATLHYDRQLFGKDDMERLLTQWQAVLIQIVEEPGCTLSNLQVLTSKERQLLLQEWNATQTLYPKNVCVQYLLDKQVEHTPDCVALVCEDAQLTYQALFVQANRLAHYLQSLGVGPEVCVGLFLERSIEMVIGLLGILKAGGAYLPLDITYPQERLSFILSDAEISVLLTRKALLTKLPATEAQIVCLDETWDVIGRERSDLPHSSVTAANLAYVIYTSGSTGQPKGVMVAHQEFVNYLCWSMQAYDVAHGNGTLVHSSLAFDLTLTGLFPPLLVGSTVFLLPEGQGVEEISSMLQAHNGLSLVKLTPAHLDLLNRLLAPEMADGRTNALVIGGEALYDSSLSFWRLSAPHTRLINEYGPTETVVGCCSYEGSLGSGTVGPVPIGRPIANTHLYVLDEYQHLTSVGVPGELYIGGAGLTRGYLNRPELTAERFVPDPFSASPGQRLYRTGDLVRYLDDGNLVFLGRLDYQVKVRGYRIELGEIETHLLEHPAVHEAVVVARDDIPGDKRLVAYVVGKQAHSTLSTEELRAYLQGRLPAYMVPTFFMKLKKLPLTANAKVDREALPVPTTDRSDIGSSFVAARTEIEAKIASLWSEVLQVKEIGIHDNFFTIGGDSILGIQFVTLAKQAGIYLTPHQLFQYQTIAQLASIAEEGGTSRLVEPAPTDGPVPLTPIQHWFFSLAMPERHHYNYSSLFELRMGLCSTQLLEAMRLLLLQHDALRLRFVYDTSGWQQYQAGPCSDIPFLSIDLSNLEQNQQVDTIEALSSATQKSLDLATSPLLRSLFFATGARNSGYLLLVAHHLVVDVISWRILLDDLGTALSQLARGEDVHFPDKTSSFQYWSQTLSEYAQSEHLQRELPYWLAIREARVKPLPVDLLAGANTVMAGETVSVHLDVAQTQALLQDVPAAYHTQINDILLTALVRAFAPWTRQRRLLIDLEGHGREEVLGEINLDLSRSVGWFTALFPVLLDIAHATTIAEEIKAVKEQLRQIPQHGISYGLLRYLHANPDVHAQMATLPLAQVSFNYLGQFRTSSPQEAQQSRVPAGGGFTQSNRGQRSHLLIVSGSVTGGQLHFTWDYSRQVHQPETIRQLAQRFVDALHAIIIHCQSHRAGGYTPSDFPLATLDQSTLDQLVERVRQPEPGGKVLQIEDIYPLSSMQAGMLFHSLYSPTVGMYQGLFGWIIEGSFNIRAWQRAWQQVVNRHSILRTLFLWQEVAEPLQVVMQRVQLNWNFYDWRGIPLQKQRALLDTLYREHSQLDFDLGRPPLLRLTLISLGEHGYYFLMCQHHILWDGWSQPLLLREVQTCYEAYCNESDPVLAAARPYRDYIAWLQQQDMGRAEQFWRTYLHGFTSPTLLDVDRSPALGGGQTKNAVDMQHLQLSEEESRALLELARQHGLTVNTIIQGAWGWLLALYSNTSDVIFGATVAGRSADIAGMESMVGLFINTLPVRVQIAADRPLIAWLSQIQEQQAEMRQYEYTSLTDIKGWSEVPADQPLFESILLFQNYPAPHRHESSIAKEKSLAESSVASALNLRSDRGIELTNYPLDLTVALGSDLIGLHLSYQKARFAADTISNLMEHLRLVLVAMGTRRDQRLGDLPRLIRTESEFLVSAWAASGSMLLQDKCLPQLIAEQVARTPDALAVQFGESSLSYAALNQQADLLASQLLELGVGPDSLVGVCLPRSLELMVALLAVLKAGGAYVPLDLSSPPQRLQWMVEDAQPALLLTLAHEPVPCQFSSIPVLAVTTPLEACPGDGTLPGQRTLYPENLTCLLYTSGSTGQPKGVMLTHRGVCNHLLWRQASYPLTAGDATLQKAPLSFDVSLDELFWPLLAGARLVLARPEGHQDHAYLLRLIVEQAITTVEFVPSLLALLMEEEGWTATASLRQVLCGGEALSVGVQETFLAGHSAALYNTYGPAETTVDACSWICQPEPAQSNIPIGRPVANTQVYILDAQGLPVPTGVKGEIYIGGEGLARGYQKRADLTAEQFVPHPWSQAGGARLYRSGDRGRYRQDGVIEYLGRVDRQLKRYGVRIEPGEIEGILQQHDEVEACVVVLQGAETGNGRLIAYIVGRTLENKERSKEQLRQYALARLPRTMLPAQYVFMEQLPLTAQGKVDRQKLVQMEEREEEERENDRQWSPIEEMLQQIWGEVLKVPIGEREQSFFELGGHSLLATRVISRVRSVLGVELGVRELFEAPTIAQLAQRVEQELRGGQGMVPPLVSVQRGEQPIPLSFAQQRLWFLDQLEPGNTAYLIQNIHVLSGPLDLALLQRSLQELAQRHESLRTTFGQQAAQPIQVIHPFLHFPLLLIDLQAVEGEGRVQQMRRLIQQEKQQPCDLQRGPLLRVRVLRLGAEQHVLLDTVHHILSDGWSSDIFYQELSTIYQAFMQGKPSPLAPLPIQYADFAIWQRQWLQGAVLERQIAYWREQLEGCSPLELPTDYPRPPVKMYRGALRTLVLPVALQQALLALSQREQVTLFMLLLAAFQVLLFRYSGQQDIAVGTPIANRSQKEVEGLIGFFINTLVLRSQVQDSLSFEQLLRQLRETALGAYAHQDVPFEHLVEVLQPPRDLSRSTLFQAFFTLQHASYSEAQPTPPRSTTTEAVASTPTSAMLASGQTDAKFDLSLHLLNSPSGLSASFEYSTDLFAASTIERLLQYWQRLLEGIVSAPHTAISALPLLTDEQLAQLLWHDNASQSNSKVQGCLHELFEEQVSRSPDALALVWEEEQLSYRQLDERANQLARQLLVWGVSAESSVGLALPRGPLLVIAVLAILKAGGCYLPLDPQFPMQRLSWMLQEAQVRLVLTQQIPQETVEQEQVRWVCLDEPGLTVWQQPTGALHQPTDPGQAAYVLYTSGSTGRPKGVVVEHRQVVSYVSAIYEQAGLSAQSSYGMLQPLTVDSSVTMLYGALLTGGVLHVIGYERSLEAEALGVYLQERAIDHLKIAPTHLAALMRQGEQSELLPGRRLIVGGEASQWDWLQGLQRSWPEGEVYNHYGPTETTVGSMLYRVREEPEQEATGATPLGRPLGQTQIYLVDRQGQLQLPGAIGELYIGGAGVARGYVGRPDLTAERFVPHEWSEVGGERVYRTGDLVRSGAEGRIEYVGRRDEQVKLRGYRIEISEIEAVLSRCKGIEEARVIMVEGEAGEKQLVGYVVGQEGKRRSKEEVQEEMHKSLPEYMVPRLMQWVEQLPRTVHGKVDRQALLAWWQKRELEEEKRRSQGREVEELLASIWEQVLGVPQVKRQDQFFALGGHSLLAAQLIARIRASLRVEIPLRWLFETPKLMDLAKRIEDALRGNQVSEELPLESVSRLQELPLSFAQQRLWFLDQLEPGSPLYIIPGIRLLRGPLEIRVLERSLEELVRRHESLRTTFHECLQTTPLIQMGQPMQVIHPAESICLPVIDLSLLPTEMRQDQKQRLVQQVMLTPFALAHQPLLRFWVLRLDLDEHLFLVAMHHIISDGWSMNVLYHELRLLYQAFSHKRPSPLQPLPIQYADFAVWQRQRLQGEVLEQQLDYWRRQLNGVPPLVLPADYPRPGVSSHRGAGYAFSLSSELSQALITLSRQEDVTLFMLLLTAFQVLFYRYTGQTDIVVGTDSANRSHVETEDLIGFFINLLALRTHLRGTWSFQQVLHQVRETVLGAYTHQEAPFELLVEKIVPEHLPNQLPLVQALFVMQNFPELDEKMTEHVEIVVDKQQADVPVEHLAEREMLVKFDLAMFMREEAGRLYGSLDYKLDLFAPPTIATMIDRFAALLQSIVQQSNIPLDQLNLLTAAEQAEEAQREQSFRSKLRNRQGKRFDLSAND